MSKEMNKIFNQEYLDLMQVMQEKIDIIQLALGMMNNTEKKVDRIENALEAVGEKLHDMEHRLLRLLESMTNHLNLNEDRMSSMEKKLAMVEMKEMLIKEGYNKSNLSN